MIIGLPTWFLLSQLMDLSNELTLEDFVLYEIFLLLIVLVDASWLIWIEWKRQQLEARVRCAATNDDRGFFLVLRSFSQIDFHETQGGSIDLEGRLPAPPESVLPELGKALYNIGIPILIGDPTLDNSEGVWPGIIVRTTDRSWRKAFHYLGKHCRAIILAPGDSPSSMEEIKIVQRTKLWKKTIVLMVPPVYSSKITRYYGQTDPKEKPKATNLWTDTNKKVFRQKEEIWSNLRERLLSKDIRLPVYEASGFLYLPNEDFSIRHGVAFSTLSESSTEEGKLTVDQFKVAFQQLLHFEKFPGTPVKEIVENLVEIESGDQENA